MTTSDIDRGLLGPQVSRRSRLTVTESCVEALVAAIDDGIYPTGSKLPAEADLAVQLQVSRATIREALQTLQLRGLVRREHGRGTFVSERSINKDLNHNFGITQMIQTAGYKPSSQDLSVGLEAAGREVAKALGVGPEDHVICHSRVMLADNKPVVWSENYLSASYIPRTEWRALKAAQSLYGYLHDRCGITVTRAAAELVPVVATKSLSDVLKVPKGAPLLCLKQTDFDERGAAVVYSVEYHVAGWVHFTVERNGPW